MNELLAEETWFKGIPSKGLIPLPSQTVLDVPTSNQSRSSVRKPLDECSFCHQKGHWKAQCPRLAGRSHLVHLHLGRRVMIASLRRRCLGKRVGTHIQQLQFST